MSTMTRFDGSTVSSRPTASALIVCGRAIVDEATKNKSLIDIFDTINAPQLPAVFPICVYICLLRGSDDTDEVFLGLFAPSGNAIIKAGMKIESWPESHAELVMPFPPLKFEEEGAYDL